MLIKFKINSFLWNQINACYYPNWANKVILRDKEMRWLQSNKSCIREFEDGLTDVVLLQQNLLKILIV